MDQREIQEAIFNVISDDNYRKNITVHNPLFPKSRNDVAAVMVTDYAKTQSHQSVYLVWWGNSPESISFKVLKKSCQQEHPLYLEKIEEDENEIVVSTNLSVHRENPWK